MLLSIRPWNPRSQSTICGHPTFISQAISALLPFTLAGSLLLTPLASQAHTSATQAARHNARLAKRQTMHQAHLAKIKANHAAQMAAHWARQIAHQRAQAARLAKARQAAGRKYAKLHQQHLALTSGNVVEAAYAFRGTRYVMGGTSRSGFDCSGFVRYILSSAGGVKMPRTAVEQYYHGTPIPTADLQPGDLVFFKNTYKHGISHVGIYAGQGKFIHAANAHKGVRMDSLSEPYYVHHYAGARRVLPAQMREAAFLEQTP